MALMPLVLIDGLPVVMLEVLRWRMLQAALQRAKLRFDLPGGMYLRTDVVQVDAVRKVPY